jgi:nucleoid-associated protein YgaU
MKNIILNKIAQIKQKFADVDTENELEIKEKTLSFKGALYVVAGLHVAVFAGIVLLSSATKARAIAAEDKTFLENAPMVGVEYPTIATTGNKTEATPSPKPVAVAKPTPTPIPASMIQIKVISEKERNPNYPTRLREYVVKKGDTFHKIAKTYKVNEKKLQTLNNIKDINKISVGQKLKLM